MWWILHCLGKCYVHHCDLWLNAQLSSRYVIMLLNHDYVTSNSMEQSPSWYTRRHCESTYLHGVEPEILFLCVQGDCPCVMFHNMLVSCSEESLAPCLACGPPFFSCPWLFIQYICGCLPYHSIHNLRIWLDFWSIPVVVRYTRLVNSALTSWPVLWISF